MRTFVARCAAAALLLGALAAPADADGLSRFEKAIRKEQEAGKFPTGTLTYKSGKALGDNGFVLDAVVFTPPPDKGKAEPVPVKRLTVEDFDFDSLDKNLSPHFLKMRAEGVAIAAKPAEGVDLAQMAGIDRVTADFNFDYRLDPERKTMTVNRVELDLNGLARLELSMVLDGVVADQPDAALNDATLRTATLVFDDRSLLGKALPAAAKAKGADADALIAMGTAILDGMRKDQGPATLAVFDAVESYMLDYRHPKGQLRLTLNPPEKTTAASLATIRTPEDAIRTLGLTVSYPGTRPQGSADATTEPPSPAQAAAAAAAAAAAKAPK